MQFALKILFANIPIKHAQCLLGTDLLSREAILSKLFLSPFGKGIYSKRKEFAPLGRKFFPFTADPLSEGAWCAEKQTVNHKLSPLSKWQKFYQVPIL